MKSDLKGQLLSKGLVSEADIETAEARAGVDNISFQEALVNLNMVQTPELGKCLSIANELPYKKLSGLVPPKSAQNVLSAKCARHWEVFPVDYNAHINLMTMAVKDADHALKMSRIYRFLLDAQDVAFTVAPEPELLMAIKSLSRETERPVRSAQVKTLRSSETADADQGGQMAGGKPLKKWTTAIPRKKDPEEPKPVETLPVQGSVAKPSIIKTPHEDHSEQLLNSLSSAVSMLVTAHLSGKTKELSRVRTTARYCQLAAARLNFSTEQTVRLVIAAWLSALKDKPEVIRQFSSPYDLEAIIFHSGGDEASVEALVLGLVDCYHIVEKKFPNEYRDVNFVRRHLHIDWSPASAHQDIVETFLQILMDEQFMNKFDHTAGTILLVDLDGSAVTDIESPLTRAGYNVHIAGSPEEGQSFIYEAVPDFIIANATKNEDIILELCKKMKAEASSRAVPLVVLLSSYSTVRGAEFLRAGADDFLTTPVDVELLYLKIEKQMLAAAVRPAGGDEGVTGSLADMSFCDMLQMLNVSCKSMDIMVTRGDLTGRVVLRQGSVIHSQLGDIIGENAFYQLMQWHDGKFSMKECREFPEATVTSSTMSLLMEGARLADEDSR